MNELGSRLTSESFVTHKPTTHPLLHPPGKPELLEGRDWVSALSEAPSIFNEFKCL